MVRRQLIRKQKVQKIVFMKKSTIVLEIQKIGNTNKTATSIKQAFIIVKTFTEPKSHT